MSNAMVSIIIPVYNVEKYLKECLDSVVTQTYGNLDIICIDDASTDNSALILEEYAKGDKRIRVIKNNRKKGPAAARNAALAEVKGKYTYFVDSDDYIERNAIEKLFQYAEEFDTEGIYFNSKLLMDTKMVGRGPSLCYGLKDLSKIVYDGPCLFKILKRNRVYTSSIWRCFWKTDFLWDNHLTFSEEMIMSEDGFFSLQAILCGKRMMMLDEVFHTYRRREGSLTTEASRQKMICTFKDYCMLLDFWKKHQFDDEINAILDEYLKNRLITAKRLYLRNKNAVEVKDFNGGVEQHLFEVLILQEYEHFLDSVDQGILHEIKQYQHVIVYGAYMYSAEVVERLSRKGVHITCLAITEMHEKAAGINGIPLYEIKDICQIKDKAIVVLGVGENNRKEVVDTLRKYGFMNYVSLD